jgi:hypothetical protein
MTGLAKELYSSEAYPFPRLAYSQGANTASNGENIGANSAPHVFYQSDEPKPATPTLGNFMAASDDLTDAKIGKASAETDTKIARLEGKIDTLSATILAELRGVRDDVRNADQYNRGTRWALIGVMVTSAFALGALGIGLVTYGDAIFGRGMNVRDVIQATVKDVYDQSKKDIAK